ncbi:tandem-95 repeat protein, partial [bacterium]|nr:tandem-95 repeat protein [bacterium]
ASRTFKLTVNSVNDEPTIGVIASQTTSEDTTKVVNFTINDPDGALNCSTAMQAISLNSNIVANSGTPAPVVFSGTYPNCSATITPVPNANGQTVMTFVADDGALSGSRSFQLSVTAVNDAPTLTNPGNKSTNEDTPITVNVDITDVDNTLNCTSSLTVTSDNQTLLPATGISKAQGSTLNGTTSCAITLTPQANLSGTATLSLAVSDGTLTSSTETFQLTVNAVNDAPTISAISAVSIQEDSSTTISNIVISDVESALSCASTANGGSLSATSSNAALMPVANITFGSNANGCAATLVPVANQNGTSNIKIIVTDGSATSESQFTLTVGAVNDPPTLSSISDVSITQSFGPATRTFTLTDIDSTVACTSTYVTATSSNTTLLPDANISVSGSGTNCTLTMNPVITQTGTSTITVTATDTTTPAVPVTFVLTVNPQHAPTITVSAAESTDEDVVKVINLAVGDADGALTCSTSNLSYTSTNTTLVANTNAVSFGGTWPNCTATVSSSANESGSTTLRFTINDGLAQSSAETVLTVNAVDDAPVISNIANQSVNEDATLSGVVVSWTDIDSTYSCTSQLTATSSDTTLLPNSGISKAVVSGQCQLSFQPAANQNGSTTITVGLPFGSGSVTKSFTLTVNPVNDAPTISSVANQTSDEDTAVSNIAVNINDIDAGTTLSCSTSLSASSSNKTLLPDANITFSGTAPNCQMTLTPAADKNGSTTVTLSVTDGVAPTTTTFTYTVNPINDVPTIEAIADVSTTEDIPTVVSFTANDADGNLTCTTANLAYSVTNSTLLAGSSAVRFGGAWPNCYAILTPAANLSGESNVTFTVRDIAPSSSSRTFKLTVVAENDAPTITAVSDQTVNEDTTINVPVTVTDVENTLSCATALTILSSNTSIFDPTGVVPTGSSTGKTSNCVVPIRGVTNANTGSSGPLTVTFRVSDGELTADSSFQLTITPVNDAPTLSSIADTSTLEDTAKVISG